MHLNSDAFKTTNGATNGYAADEMIDTLYSFWPGATPAPQPLREAAFSLTLKGTLGGQEALLTARGQSPEEFRRNLEAIRGLLDPVQTQPATLSPDNTTFQGQGEGWCSKHGLHMKLNQKEGRSWFSHQVDGQWCKGR
jgi:hypothetical protein